MGVLTQYQPLELNSYISTGAPWDLDSNTGGVFILPPYLKAERGEWYSGTANAIYQNSFFIDKFDPDYILVLSGDHIYKMDYNAMLKFHIKTEASATIAVIEVPIEDASRFGIMNTDENFRVIEFEEKPAKPKSNLASMGVYIFNWRTVKAYLQADAEDKNSINDFGRDIIPKMLAAGERIFAYRFKGYWKDVGTVESLWEANMELLQDRPALNLHDPSWKILSRNPNQPPHFVGDGAKISTSLVSEGCRIYGTVEHSVLFHVTIAAGLCATASSWRRQWWARARDYQHHYRRRRNDMARPPIGGAEDHRTGKGAPSDGWWPAFHTARPQFVNDVCESGGSGND